MLIYLFRKLSCTIIFLALFQYVSGQSPLPSISLVKTPEVTAFNKFIETPVSGYTGVPSISIPLYNISINGVSVPITLNYHAGGIRVDQEATWVGLGWSLDYGGSISRKVRGAPDEDAFMFGANPNNTNNIDKFNNMPVATSNAILDRLEILRSAKYQSYDFIPDEYYYSALGQSGRFMFSQRSSKYLLFPKEDISVSLKDNPGDASQKLWIWNLKLPEGTQVDFGADAFTAQKAEIKAPKSSWQIKRILNRFNDSITYSYESFNYYSYPLVGVKATMYKTLSGSAQAPLIDYPTSGYSKVLNYDSRVKSINFPNGKIEFITVGRYDMPTQALSEIRVLNKAGILLKKISFLYSYFNGSAYDILPVSNSILASNIGTDYRFLRLKLNALEIKGSDNTSQRYSFEYNGSVNLPSKFTHAQDHWGYYNGSANTTIASFIPNIQPGLFTGGERKVNPQCANAFSLKSITYPEGGKRVFEYESNTAQSTYIPNELLQTYQDDNIPEVTKTINVSSYSRRSYFPSPDSVSGDSKFFLKKFKVSNNAYIAHNMSFTCSTNYGISQSEQYTPYSADNAEFYLYRIEPNGNKVLIHSFNTTPQNQSSNGTYARNGTHNALVWLPPGNYEMGAKLTYLNPIGSPAESQPYSLIFNIKYRELDTVKKMIFVGGLRIKSISYLDTDGSLKKKKTYTYTNPTPSVSGVTSGRIVSVPGYYQGTAQEHWNGNQMDGYIVAANFSSTSIFPLETTSGSFAGYQYVDEFDSDSVSNNSLRTSYVYSFNQPYLFNPSYPFMSLRAYQPNEWENGKLISKILYKSSSVVKREDYSYYSYSPHLSTADQEDFVQEINTDLISTQMIATGYANNLPFDFYDSAPSITAIGLNNTFGNISNCVTFNYGPINGPYTPVLTTNGAILCPNTTISVPYFERHSGVDKMKTKTVTSYEFGNSIVQTENYFYNKTPALYQLTSVKILNSVNDTLETRTKFPTDSSSVDVYSRMTARHIIGIPISKSEYKNSNFLKSTSTQYKVWTDTAVIAPLQDLVKVSNGQQYTSVTYLNYDAKGNVSSAQKPGGAPISIIWNSTGSYPIASIQNSALNNVYVETFEEASGNSVANDAKTGHLSHIGQFTKTFSGIDNGNYSLNYWEKGAGGWALKSNLVSVTSGTYTFTTSSQIDDLSFVPYDAQLTYYTYEPLVGVTSITDPKKVVSYYEYDGLQRLVSIRDQDKNIVKIFSYNLGTQAANNTPSLNVLNVQNTSVSIQYTSTASASTSCFIKCTDLTNNQTFQTAINCNASASVTITVPYSGRSYKFEVLQNLVAGGQLFSLPLNLNIQ